MSLEKPISSEGGLESVEEKQTFILNRLLSRAGDIRNNYGEGLANVDEEKWKKVKKVPFIRSLAITSEAALGREPGGKNVSTKESLVKSLVAILMGVEDTFIFVEKAGLIKEENKFKGKTMATIDYLKKRIEDGSSPKKDKKLKIVQAVEDFLSKNKERVNFTEELINEFLQGKSA